MKIKLQVFLAFSLLLLISTIVGIVPVAAVKSGGGSDTDFIIKGHFKAEGPDNYDEGARVEVAANVYWVWNELTGLDKASFKKISLDDDTMLCHGEIKDGIAQYAAMYRLDEDGNPIVGVTWVDIWFISGNGTIKTPLGKISDVFIGILFCFGGTYGIGVPFAWAGYYDSPWGNILGPEGTYNRLGTIALYPTAEIIGTEVFPEPPPP